MAKQVAENGLRTRPLNTVMGDVPCRPVDLAAGQNIAVPVTGETADEVRAQWDQASRQGADLVEWRLDYFQGEPAEIAALGEEMREAHHLPVLATWRTDREGGRLETGGMVTRPSPSQLFEGTQLYADAVLDTARWADAVDVELDIAAAWPMGDLIAAVNGTGIWAQRTPYRENSAPSGPVVVVSHHEFQVPPTNSAQIITYLQKMANTDADVLKIAWIVETESELQAVLDAGQWAQENLPNPCVLIAMGPAGTASRVGEPGARSAFTFAVASRASAPGQPSVQQVRDSWMD